MKKQRAKNNRTLTLSPEEIEPLKEKLITSKNISLTTNIINKTINGDVIEMLKHIPNEFVDLIIIDPPYNLTHLNPTVLTVGVSQYITINGDIKLWVI